MSLFRSRLLRLVLPVIGIGLFVLLVPIPAPSPQTREFTIDARQFEFAPGRLEVNYGDRVIITVTASDVVHGFYLDGYGINQQITPGVSQHIEFTADQVGKFRYRCSVSCGSLHPFMIGELVVGPNLLFGKAIVIALVALGVALVFLRQRKGTFNGSIQEIA